jgi:ABC-2 type transport system permease protein
MRGAWAIAKRELLAYFQSPVAYVAIAGYLLLRALFFTMLLVQLELAQIMQRGPAPEIEEILRGTFGQDMFWGFLIIVPLLTMRLLAEERSNHTAELLLTAPMGTGQVVLGKFAAAMTVVVLMTLGSLTMPSLIVWYGQAGWLMVVTGTIGAIFFGALLVSVGLLASSFTESQFVAALLAVGLNLVLYLFGTGITSVPYIGSYLDQFSIVNNMDQLARGVIDTGPLVFFISGTGFFLFLTARLVDSQRWR